MNVKIKVHENLRILTQIQNGDFPSLTVGQALLSIYNEKPRDLSIGEWLFFITDEQMLEVVKKVIDKELEI